MKVIIARVDGKRIPLVLQEKNCIFCNKLFQPKQQRTRCCSPICKVRQYQKENPNIKKKADLKYKDKVRHDYKREELIQKTGLICTECGKVGNSYQIVAHHITGNNQEHEHQKLLCRACHCRLHQSIPKKNVTKEQIERAIKSTKNLDEACKVLGINRSSLYWKRKKFGMQFSELYKHNLTR